MATPRKNWFKVADSVAFEDWPNDVAATFLRLGAYLNTRWARDGRLAVDRGRTTVSSKILQQLTGSGSLARARRVLHELATHITLAIDEQGTSTVIEWRKYAEFQSSESGSGDANETVAHSAVPSPSPISEPSPSPVSKNEPIQEEIPIKTAPLALDACASEVISPEWGEVVDALAAYVPSRARCVETPARRARLRKLLTEFGPTAPVDAIHGYAALHFCGPRSPAFDPERNFTLETIWGQKVGKYLDADREAAESGMARPYVKSNGQGPSLQKTVVSIFDRIKAERGEMLGRL